MNNDDDSISLSDDKNSFYNYLQKIDFNNEVNESNEFNNEEIEHHLNEEINSEKKIDINNRTTTNTKRGRNKTSDSINSHSKNATDNKIRKIRIHAITFGIDLLNDCIRKELKKIYRKKKSYFKKYFSRDYWGYYH